MLFINYLNIRLSVILIVIILFTSCSPKATEHIFVKNEFNEILPEISDIEKRTPLVISDTETILTGAECTDKYIHLLKDKRVGLVVNQSALVNNIHLVDFLLMQDINIVKIFAPEHGFRGNIDRGKHFNSNIDEKTGLPIIAMYGKNRKPKKEQLADLDVVMFDIQDVGVRFYTYISSMHYMMEVCAENNKKFIVLDRPNPLGDYVDGPVLKLKYKSFVGMHQIPVVHGLTVGELAMMINGEGWLKNGIICDLEVVKVKNYDHSKSWSLPVKPSPNLPNDLSVRLYPSLCFFEATDVSIGRGTSFPFQVIGYPDKSFGSFTFVPEDITGMQMNPIQENKICYGIDLRKEEMNNYFTLKYIIDFADKFKNKDEFITKKNWFNLLAGNGELAEQIIEGMTEEQIRETWQKDLDNYKKLRKKYLLYVDFQ
ncbi:MAG: DUF1343 domain-containing protein [Bacteroidales bacterium]|nr:DUF1343 domain-containing protein [Bacteroidales bacterium]